MANKPYMATLAPEDFGRLRRSIAAVTKAGLMSTYKIGQHSWYKPRDGKPVKQSVIDRLRACDAELGQ